jgi:tripartite-type tricarboxylate transporter receptor subunit TctC
VLHFAGELLKQRAQVQLNHIPYRGTAALTSDLVGGTLDFGMLTPTAAIPFIQSGRVIPLSVTSAARLPTLPQVPTMAETPALKGYVMEGWFGVVGPRNLPADVAQKLTRALHKGLQEPEFRKRIENAGVLPPKGGEDLNTLLHADLKKYSELVKFADMKE